jgi:hypothetical protein
VCCRWRALPNNICVCISANRGQRCIVLVAVALRALLQQPCAPNTTGMVSERGQGCKGWVHAVPLCTHALHNHPPSMSSAFLLVVDDGATAQHSCVAAAQTHLQHSCAAIRAECVLRLSTEGGTRALVYCLSPFRPEVCALLCRPLVCTVVRLLSLYP